MYKTSSELKKILKKVSTLPGVYKMIDKDKQIIYVGKAKNLRKRVNTYFQNGKTTSAKVVVMRDKVVNIETTITRSELEALILETNLIKSLRPRYNVLMKDDKNYVYVKVDQKEDFPEIHIVRRFGRDGNTYFGPYTSADSILRTLKALQKIFPYRSCQGEIIEVAPGNNVFKHLSRRAPCLDYYIKRCDAPCISKITKEDYKKHIEAICTILAGNYHHLEKDWQEAMKQAVDDRQFEKAAKLRDRIQTLQILSEKQYATLTSGHNQDVLAVAKDKEHVIIALFMVRNGHVVQTEHFNLSDYAKTTDPAQIISSFMQQYYVDATSIPKEIVTSIAVPEKALLEKFISNIKGQNVHILMPERGEKRQLMQIVQENAALQLESNKKAWEREYMFTTTALEDLQKALKMKKVPRRIECYDISHISGTNKVGSMIVFIDAKPATNMYRTFTVKELAEGVNNDFASLQEVFSRRIKYLDATYRAKKKRRKEKVDTVSLPQIPDLIIIDGGKGQLSSVIRALKAEIKSGTKVNLPLIVSLAKREEEIFFPNKKEPLLLAKDSPALFLIQRIRDEAHRFAISHHRSLRSKKMIRSRLDTIRGIGPKNKKKLLTTFGSVHGIRDATMQELVACVGPKIAETIREQL